MTPLYYRTGAHTKYDLKVHLVWVPKYRKRVLLGQVAIRVRGIIRSVAAQHEVHILFGKVAAIICIYSSSIAPTRTSADWCSILRAHPPEYS
jgi:hypothetical protein